MRPFVSAVWLCAALASAQDDLPLAVYEEGKVLYDQKQYAAALGKFEEAARLEPTRARWHYNRGLALKKLHRDDEARAAFLDSQRLDPTYKSDEIRQKLGELSPPATAGPSPSPSPEVAAEPLTAVDWLILCGLCLGFLGFLVAGLVFLVRAFRRATTPPQAAAPPSLDGAVQAQLRQGLATLGPRLARLEHAMSLGEDAPARPQLDRAFAHFQHLRRMLGRESGTAAELGAVLARAQTAAAAAEERLRARHGAAFDTARGPPIGCFFCARPLPTPESRSQVTLQRAGAGTAVTACAPCARLAASATPPPVTLVQAGQGEVHWASLPDADPYTLAYADLASARERPLGRLSLDGVDLPSLAGLAGAALAGAAVGAAVAHALDLDALAEGEAASAAAEAVARSASAQRSDQRWQDHS